MEVLYYLVTGLDDGVEIEPYAIAVTNGVNDCTLEAYCGDFFNPRYLDPITKEEYEAMKEKERKERRASC